jgi:hypothetical protein
MTTPIIILVAFYLGGLVAHALSFHRSLVETKFYKNTDFAKTSTHAKCVFWIRVLYRATYWFV